MGQHDPAKEIGKQALDIEENELGARPDRMGDLYSMMAAILAEVTEPASFLLYPVKALKIRGRQITAQNDD